MYNNNNICILPCARAWLYGVVCDESVFFLNHPSPPPPRPLPHAFLMGIWSDFFHLAFDLFIYCRYCVSTFKLYVSSPCLCLYAHCKKNTPKTKSIIFFLCISVIHTSYRRVTIIIKCLFIYKRKKEKKKHTEPRRQRREWIKGLHENTRNPVKKACGWYDWMVEMIGAGSKNQVKPPTRQNIIAINSVSLLKKTNNCSNGVRVSVCVCLPVRHFD